MNSLTRWIGCVVLMAAWTLNAAEFSQRLTAEEFGAAGLDRLTPEQLAQLDALVNRDRRGELARVREETSQQVKAEIAATEKREASGGLINRLRVVLTPGTDIEYVAVETAIEGPFRGYKKGDVLRLANGQQWQVVDGNFWAPAKTANKPRKVVIEPGALGSFFLDIEDGGRPRVKIVGGLK